MYGYKFNVTLNNNVLHEKGTKGNDDINEDINNQNGKKTGVRVPSLIEFVTGPFLRHTYDNNLDSGTSGPTLMEEDRREMMSMDKFAKINKLDWKQTMAFKGCLFYFHT